jgi:hypothetical protein
LVAALGPPFEAAVVAAFPDAFASIARAKVGPLSGRSWLRSWRLPVFLFEKLLVISL